MRSALARGRQVVKEGGAARWPVFEIARQKEAAAARIGANAHSCDAAGGVTDRNVSLFGVRYDCALTIGQLADLVRRRLSKPSRGMCGIIWIIGREPVADADLIDVAQTPRVSRLDDFGWRCHARAWRADVRGRAKGKLKNLQQKTRAGNRSRNYRHWPHPLGDARPAQRTNAHPHATDVVAVVHNGIIENFSELRRELEGKGAKLATETDSEVIAHLVSDEDQTRPLAGRGGGSVMPAVRGAFALAFLFRARTIC